MDRPPVEENEPVHIEFADALEFYAAIIGGTVEQAPRDGAAAVAPGARSR